MPSNGGGGKASGSTPARRPAGTPSGTPPSPSPKPRYSGAVDLLSTHEIARLLGLSRQRVQQLTKEPGFPPPAATLNMGSVWHTADVRAWATANGRPLTG